MAEVDGYAGDGSDSPGFDGVDADELNDLNEALKQGFRRAGMHWMRAGYELLAGVSAFLEELGQRADGAADPDDPDDPAERIELE